jgi:hypothetical protein
MAIVVSRPNHCAPSAIGSVHRSLVRNTNLLAINTHAIMTILAFPTGIVDSFFIAAIAAWPFATVPALVPPPARPSA